MNGSLKISLKRRFVVAITLLVTVFFILLASSAAYIEFTNQYSQIKRQLEFFASSKLEQVDLRLSFLKESLESFALSSMAINSTIDTSGRSSYFPDAIREFGRSTEIKSVLAFDFAGKKIASNTETTPEWYSLELVRPVINSSKEIIIFDEERGAIIFIVPIIYYDTPQGGIAAEISINELLPGIILSNEYDYQFSIGNNWSIASRELSEEIIDASIRAREGSMLGTLDASLQAFQAKSIAMQPIFRKFYYILLIGIAGIIISIIVAYIVGRRLAMPILTLADKIQHGIHPCGPVGTGDELELLAESFDNNTQKILDAKHDLEEKVKERTLELEKTTEELKTQREELVTLNSALLQANIELTKIDKMKDEFVSTVSHELRTPLTSIRGILGLLANDVLTDKDKQHSMLNTALSNSVRLSNLINDLLDMQKMTSGLFELSLSSVSVAELIDVVMEGSHGYASHYDISLNHIKETTKDLYLYADMSRIRQVIDNLISNAIKYSPANGVVDIYAEQSSRKIRICVRDYGEGIPDEFREKLFTKFTQVDSSDKRARDGTGLGLSISKGIIDAHGGYIGFDEAEGGGTIFWFELESANAIGAQESI